MNLYEYIREINEHVSVILQVGHVTDENKTYFINAGDMSEDGFIDMLLGERVDYTDDHYVDNVKTHCLPAISVPELKNNEGQAWYVRYADKILTNNDYVHSVVNLAKKHLDIYINNEDAVDEYRKSFNGNIVELFLNFSTQLQLSEPVYSIDNIKNTPVEIFKEGHKKGIMDSYAQAVVILDQEEKETDSKDVESLEEIEVIKGMLQDILLTLDKDINKFDNPMDLLKYWPPLLLPAPAAYSIIHRAT